MLVTALGLEANAEVLKIEIVTGRFFYTEQKIKCSNYSKTSDNSGLLIINKNKKIKCHFCNKSEHIKKNCRLYQQSMNKTNQKDKSLPMCF